MLLLHTYDEYMRSNSKTIPRLFTILKKLEINNTISTMPLQQHLLPRGMEGPY